jgi:hypothetical protein
MTAKRIVAPWRKTRVSTVGGMTRPTRGLVTVHEFWGESGPITSEFIRVTKAGLALGQPTPLGNVWEQDRQRSSYPASYGRDSAGITRAVRRLRYRAAGIPVHEKSNPTQQTGLRRVADSDPLPLR